MARVQRRHIPILGDIWLAETLVWSGGHLVKMKLHFHLLRHGRSTPIVRYDHAHGAMHVHRFTSERLDTWDLELEEALLLAQDEVRLHLHDWAEAARQSVTSDVSHREGP